MGFFQPGQEFLYTIAEEVGYGETVIRKVVLRITSTDDSFVHYRMGTHSGNLTKTGFETEQNMLDEMKQDILVLVKDVPVVVEFAKSRLDDID